MTSSLIYEEFKSILITMDEILLVFDINGKFINFHHPSKDHGLDPPTENFIGKSFKDIFPSDIIPSLENAINILKSTGNPQQLSYPLKISGQEVWLSTTLFKRKDISDEFEGITALVCNITPRKWADEAHSEWEEKYRMLFNTGTDSLMLLDVETKCIIDINEAALSLYGYSREEFLKLSHKDITSEPEKSDESIKLLLEGKLKHISKRYHKKKDGTIFPVEISATLIDLKNQKIACGAIRDISQKLEAEEALKTGYNELEKKIKERTSELLKANNKLQSKINERKKAEEEREKLIIDLQAALKKVNTLKGLVPICAQCKKIRDDKGFWNQIESYIEKHSNASFSHGLCPECIDDLYGCEDWYQE